MANLQKFVVVLLVFTIALSVLSIVLNVIIFKMSSENSNILKQYSTNTGNIGLIVEGNAIEEGISGG
ncbi:MAG TPA: hypothetical protein VJH20_00745 [Candidatus Nanoarchaeia archaeon]|nr:hypothetical protein [Candidatus Nanoarchaeia archaeon]